MPVPWAKVEERLKDDFNGTFLCDIVVPAGAVGDWQRVLDLLREHEILWQVGYVEDGTRAELPHLDERLICRSRRVSVLISLSVGDLAINGHVSGEDWIEFDVLARDIDGQESLDALAVFVTALGRALGKEVRATPEAAHDAPIFVFDPSIDGVRPT